MLVLRIMEGDNVDNNIIKSILNQKFSDFIIPFLNTANLVVDVDRFNQIDSFGAYVTQVKHENGGYAGTITLKQNGIIDFYICLNTNRSVVLSGRYNDINIEGCIVKLDESNVTDVKDFKTFNITYDMSKINFSSNYYAKNVTIAASKNRALYWTYDAIEYMLTKSSELLISEDVVNKSNVTYEEIINILLG